MVGSIKCLLFGHKWNLGADGGYFGFLSRKSIFTGIEEVGYTCERCGKISWFQEEIPKDAEEQLAKQGFKLTKNEKPRKSKTRKKK